MTLSDTQPSGVCIEGTRVPGAASGSDGDCSPTPRFIQSDPQIGNPGEESPAVRALRWELAAGNYRRELDEMRSELRRLARDRNPESDEYPEDLFEVAERLKSLLERL
jgi:hypothetical protein